MSFDYFVGLDVHFRRSNLCILDSRGNRVKRMAIRGGWNDVIECLKKIEGRIAICYEASCGYGHLYDRLSTVAARVVVAHPGQTRLIFRSKRKNDRIDAERLAKLLLLDEVPPVYVPSADVRAWRQLIEYRERLIKQRTGAKNSCRALLRSLGIEACKNVWSGTGLAWLRALELPELHALRRDMVVNEIELFNQQIARVEKELSSYSLNHPGVFLLKSIPGVGIRTAETMVAYIDNPQRFKNSKAVGAYFGLVPSQDQSSSTNRLGHITKDGPGTARRLLAEATWQAIRKSPTIRKYFERIAQDNPERRKIALIATAHYLARVMQAMLRTGELWRESVRPDEPNQAA